MNLSVRVLLALLAASLITLGLACGDEAAEEDTDDGNNEETEEVDVPEDWEYESDYHLRFTSFAFEDGTTGAELNQLLASNIRRQDKDYPVIVLIHLDDVDAEEGSLSLRGGAGLKADQDCEPDEDDPANTECEYEWDPDGDEEYNEDVPFDVDTGNLQGSLEQLDFIATFELGGEVKKAVVPIQGIEFDGDVEPIARRDADGEVVVDVHIEDAKLTGYLTEEDGDDTAIEVAGNEVLLSGLLEKQNIDYDSTGDGEDDAWWLEGRFDAYQTIVVE